jgi:hypothetical protein
MKTILEERVKSGSSIQVIEGGATTKDTVYAPKKCFQKTTSKR